MSHFKPIPYTGLAQPAVSAFWKFVLSGAVSSVLIGTATGQESTTAIEELIVTGRNSPTMALPTAVTNDSIERSQLDATNLQNADDALRYATNFQIRKRYLGDQNGAPAMRGTTGPQSARSYVVADGVPISNLLGSGFGFSPRWGLIAPDEIESVDIMYGPYSALYSGNTLGAGIFITTRMPDAFESSVGATGGFQRFHGYESDMDLENTQIDASIGNRHGNVSWALYANAFQNEGQPGYFLTTPVSTGSTTLPGVPVIGALRETDPGGIDRWLFGASSTIDEEAQLLKGKVSWDIDDSTRLFVTAAYRDQLSELMDPESYLRNTAGAEVRTGRVMLGERSFNLDAMGVQMQRVIINTEDLLVGATLQKRFSPNFALEASVSRFDMLDADNRNAYIVADPVGQVNITDDQGWHNAALRLVWDPSGSTILGRTVVGSDYAEYWNQNSIYASPDFRAGIRGNMAERNRGKSDLLGLFGETTFTLTPTFDVTAGARWEQWEARDGLRVVGALSLAYPVRRESQWSPKLVLTWRPADDWSVQARAAEAYRFATVSELFQARTTGGVLIQSDPNLKPEHAQDVDISVTHLFDLGSAVQGRFTLSAFREDVDDVIFNQFNAFTLATYNQNVDHVVVNGIEGNAAFFGLMGGKFDLDFSVSHQEGEIRANAGQAATVGNDFPRIPNWRGKLLATWRPIERLATSVGLRYEGKQYNDLLNTDDRSGGYGYMSDFFLVDVKAQYAVSDNLTAAIGVDNLTDELAYYFHPYPMRTVFASLRWRH